MWRFLKVFKCLLISCSLICLHQNEVFSFKINPKDVEKQWSVLVNSTEQPGLARTAKNCGTSINRFYDELDNIKNQTTEKLAVIKDTAEVKNLAVGFKKQVVSSTTNLNDVQRNVYKLAGHFKDKYKNGLWGIEIDSQNTFDKLNEMKSTPVDNTKSLPGSAARMFGNRHDYEKLSNKILSVSLDDQQLMDDLKKKRTKARAEFSSLYNALDKWTKNVNNIAFETMDVFFKGISSIKSIKRKVKEFKEDALSKIDENELAAVQNAIELAKALKFIFKTQITHDSNEIFDDEPTADDDTSTQADDSNEENNINKENKSIPKNEIQNQKSLSDIAADSTPRHEPKKENLDLQTSNESTISNSSPNDTSNVNDTKFSPLDEEKNNMTKNTPQENPNNLTIDSVPTSEPVNLLTSNESIISNASPNDTLSDNGSTISPLDKQNDIISKQTSQENPKDLIADFTPKHKKLDLETSNESNISNSSPIGTLNVNDIKFSPLDEENNNTTKNTPQENPNGLTTDSVPTSEPEDLLTSNELTNSNLTPNDTVSANDTSLSPLDKANNHMSKQTSQENPKDFTSDSTPKHEYLDLPFNSESTTSNPSPNDTSSMNDTMDDDVHNKAKPKHMRRKKKLLSWDELIKKPEPIVSSESNNCVNALKTSISDLNSIKLSTKNKIQAAKDENELKVTENDAIKKYQDNMKKTNSVLANRLIDVAENACETVKSIDDKYETKFKNDPNLQRVSYLLGKKYDPNYYILQVLSEADTNSNKNGVSGKKKPSYYKMVSVCQNLINETNEMDESALYAMNKIYEGLIATKDLSKEANKESAQKALYILRKLKEDENEEDIISKTENHNKVQEKIFDDDNNNVRNQNENHNSNDNLQPNAIAHKNEPKVPVDVDLGDNTHNKQIAEDYPRSQEVDDEDSSIDNLQPNAILHKNEPKVPVDVDLGENTNNKQIAEDYPRSQEGDDEDDSIENLQPNAIAHNNKPKVPVDVDLGENTNNKQIAEDYPRSQEVDDEDNSIDNLQPNAILHKNEPKVPVDVDLGENTNNKQIAEDYPRSQEVDDEDDSIENLQPNAIAHKNEPKVPVDVDLGDNTHNKQIAEDYPRSQEVDDEDDSIENLQPNAIAHKNEPKVPVDVDLGDNTNNKQIAEDYPRSQEVDDDDNSIENLQPNAIAHKNEPKVPVDVDLGENTNNKQIAEDYPRSQEVDDEDNSIDNLQPNAIAHKNEPKVPVDVDLGDNTNNKQIAEDYPRSQEVDDEDNSIDNLQPNAIAHKNEPKVPVDVDLGDNTNNKQIAEDYPRSQEVDDEDSSIDNLQPNAILHKNEPKVPVDVDLGENTNNKQIAEDYPRSQEVDDEDDSIENLQPNAIAHKNEPKVPVDVDLEDNTHNKQIAEDYPRSQEVDDEDSSIDNLQPNAILHKNEPKVPVDVDLGDNTNNKQIAEDYPRSQEVDDEDSSIDNLQPNAILHKNEPKVPVDVDLGDNTNNKQIAEDYPRSQEVDDEDSSIDNLQPNAILHKNEPKVPVDVDLGENTNNKQIAEDYPRSQEGDDEDKISEKTQENDSINESSGILPGNKDDGILINASVSNPVSVENIPDEGSESILHFPETAEQPRNEMDPHHDKIATNQVFDNAFEPSMSTENIEQDKKENPNLNSTQNIIPKIDKESLNKDQENDDSELLDSVENAIPSVVQNKKIVNSVLSSEEFDEDDGDSLDEMKNNKGSESILHSPETAEQPRNEMDPHHDKIATDQVFDNAFKPSMSTVNVEQDKKENPTLNSTQNIIPKIDKESLNKDQENDDSELLDSVENAIPSVVQNKKIVNSVLSSEEFDEDDGDSLDEMKNNKGSESILHSPETAEQPRNEMDPHHDKIATDQVFDNAFKPSMSTENIEQDKKENPNLNSTQNIIPKIDKESLNKDQENDDSELLDSVENAIPSVVQNKKIVNSVLSSEEFDKDDGDSLDEMKNNKGSESILHSPETAEQPRNEMDPHHDKIATDQVFDNAFKPSMSTVNDEQDKEENPNLNSTQNIIPKIDKESLNKDQENDDSELLDSVENAIPSVVQNKKIVSPVLSSEEFDGDDEESLDQVKTNTFKSSSRPDILETPNLNGANPVIPTPVQEIMPNTLLDDQISTEVKLPSLDEKDPINKKIVHTEPYNEGLNKGHAIPDKNANIIAEPVLSNLEGDSSEALLGESIPKINKEIHKSSEGNGSTEVLDSVENVTPSVTQNENLPKSVVSSKEYEGDQPGSQDKIKNNDDKENVLKNLSGEEQLNNKIDMDNNNRADVGDNTITGDPTEVNHDKYELPSVDDAQSRLHDNELKNSLESGDLVKPEQDSQDMPGDTKYNTITEPIHEIPEINGKEPLLNKIPETNNENLTNNKLNNSSEITNNVDDAKPSFDNQKIVNPIESSNEYNEEPKSQAEPNNEDQQIITKIPLSEEQPNNEVNAGKYNETPYLNNETVVSPLGENMSEHIPTEDDLSDKDRIFSPVEGGSNNSVEFDKQPRDGNRNELESPLSTSTIAPDFVLINDIAEEMPPKSEIESNADEEKPEVPFEQPNKNDGKKVKAKRYRKRRITYLINKTTGKRTAVKEEIIPIDTDKTPKVSTENEIVNQDEPKNADEIDNQDEPKTADEIDNQDEPKTADKDDSNLLYNSNAEQCKITAYEELTKIASYDIKKLVFSIGLLSSKLRNNVMSDIKQANNDVKQSDLRGQVDQVVERTRKAIDVNFEQSIGEMREKLVLLAQKFVETTNGLKNTYKVRPRTTHEMLSSITVDPLPVSETAGAALSIISPQFNIDKAVRRILEARPSGRVKNLHDKKYDTQRKLIDLSRLMDTAVNNFECLMLSVINEIGIGVDTLKVLNSSKLMMSSQNPRAKALKNAMTIVQEILGRASGNQSGASAKFANRSIDSEPVADMKNKQKPVGVIVVHPDMTIRYKQLPGNKELKKFVAEESKPYKKGKTKVSPKFLEVDNKKLIQNIINDTKKRAKQAGMTDAETVNEIVRKLNTKH